MTSTHEQVATRELYLDLVKRSLTGALAEDNDSILGGVRTQGSPSWKKRAANAVGLTAQRFGFEIAFKKPYSPQLRALGQDWPSRAESMIGLRRMDNLRTCVQSVIEDGVPGDLIETGVWRGGACIFMRAVLKAYGDTTRKVWVADSFEGLPPPNAARFPADEGDTLHELRGLAIGVEQVRHNFERYGLLDDQVEFLVGWFKDTLPTAPIEQVSVMRLDGDMYESTWQAIEVLYPKLSVGGFCIVDDFGSHVSQAQQAVHDYRAQHGITDPIVDIDGTGAFWAQDVLTQRMSSVVDEVRDGYHNSVRDDVVPSVPRSQGTLLDVGGGTGATAVHMKAVGRAARAGIVDLVPSEAMAPELDFAYHGDLEDRAFLADVIAREGPFDTILCLDVLEHLVDPWGVVAQLHKGLRPGGVIVASIPNVRHYRVSAGLLFANRWRLDDAGIMDRTHLRFFVRGTAIELMTHTGLVLEDVMAPMRNRRPTAVRWFKRLTRNRLDTLVDVDYVIRVRRPMDGAA